MANIRIDLQSPIINGMDITFPAPADCSKVTGLIVYYKSEDNSTAYKAFSFRDAHKNDLSSINNLFSEGVYIKVILDVVNGHAYIQNADTNAYLEGVIKDINNKLNDVPNKISTAINSAISNAIAARY